MKAAESASFIQAGSTRLTSLKSEQLEAFANRPSQTCSVYFSNQNSGRPRSDGSFNHPHELGKNHVAQANSLLDSPTITESQCDEQISRQIKTTGKCPKKGCAGGKIVNHPIRVGLDPPCQLIYGYFRNYFSTNRPMQVICFFLILPIFRKNLGIPSLPTLWSLAKEESCTHYGIFECS